MTDVRIRDLGELTGPLLAFGGVYSNFQALERLKTICESELFSLIDVENCAAILYTASVHNSIDLRNTAIKFILDNFDLVSKTVGFHNVARADVELVIELLRLR